MSNKIVINAVDPDECRVANVKNSKLVEFQVETATKEILHGNIYKGVVTRVEPSLQAVFVDYGGQRHGFLQKNEIHQDYFQDNPSKDHSISNLVKRGQELLVQVTKDPFMKKGAMLTTFISLPGRYVVFMPGSKSRGVSRKIGDEEERERLKKLMGSLTLSDDFGLIIRTAGIGCTKKQITKDLNYLLRLWKDIQQRVNNENAPSLLYKESNLVVRSLRDYFTTDITEILVDDESVCKEVRAFIRIISPKSVKNVKHYKGKKPIFTKFQLENQIASIFKSRVNLKSGGSIVIEQTEALVAVDVNSGKANKGASIEQTALETNLEAAEEIARQLHLRDLGGLVVLDFIDMKDSKHKLKVEKAMKTHVKADKAKTKIGKISKFGLMEMSRQRIRPSIEHSNFTPCQYCHGKGQVPSPEMLGLGFLRKLKLETLKNEIICVEGIVPPDVASYLLNKKRKVILSLETTRGINITIKGDGTMVPGDDKITCTFKPSSD